MEELHSWDRERYIVVVVELSRAKCGGVAMATGHTRGMISDIAI